MTRFENIHTSKLAAFIDGACTAAAFLWLASIIRKRRSN